MLSKLKNLTTRFYFSIATITLLSVVVLVFIYSWGSGYFQSYPPIKKVYYADNISPTHKALVDRFNQLHKGSIEVIPIDLPFEKFSTNERKELLIRYLRNRSEKIDIFSVDQIWVPRFAKWTEPLDKYFITSEKNNIVELAKMTCYNNNELVAIPLYFDIGLLYYNDSLLQTLPNYHIIKKELSGSLTWEKFIEIGKSIKKNGNLVYLYPADDFEGLMCSFVELLESQNEKLFIGDSIRLSTPSSERALNLLVDLVDKLKFAPKEITDYRESECYHAFVKEDVFFLRGWTGFNVWYYNNIEPKDVSAKYMFAPLPYFTRGKPASILGGWNMMLSKYSTKKNESIEFIKFMISEEAQKIMFEKGGYLPVNKSIYKDELFMEKHPEINFYKSLKSTGAHRPFLEKYTRCSDIIAHYLNLAIQKKIGVKEALVNAERVINSGEFFIK